MWITKILQRMLFIYFAFIVHLQLTHAEVQLDAVSSSGKLWLSAFKGTPTEKV